MRLVQWQIQHRPVLELELYDLLALPVGLELRQPVVAADAVPQVDDIVALAKFGEVEKLVYLRAPRKHSPARLYAVFLASAEKLARADKRRALGVGRQDFPVRAVRAEVADNKTLAESRRHEFSLKRTPRGLEYSERELFVARAVGRHENGNALFAPVRQLSGELFAAVGFGLEPVRADFSVNRGDFRYRLGGENFFLGLLESFRASLERRNRRERIAAAGENFAEPPVNHAVGLRALEKQRRTRRQLRGLEKNPLHRAAAEIVAGVPRTRARVFGIGDGVDGRRIDFGIGKLRVGVEFRNRVDFVAEKVEAHRRVRRHGVDVDYPAAHRKLSGGFA